ncbi:MobC family plasmid mobilization relaxosome protein [Streptomyces sp. NPDC001339]|uniref:MobC family plasmid mobilization relaxosome protein n=1 Tax=Streptomyces sp. NPDC001339 TaxID=3364563 RepID=UPI0036B7C0BF
MYGSDHELATPQEQMPADATDAARYPAGPSTGRFSGEASAPGVAEAGGHQGVPGENQPAAGAVEAAATDVVDDAAVAVPLSRAADEAALHRVARRRKPDPNGRREKRVDARYSVEEKAAILAKAKSLHVSGAHYVAVVALGHVHGDLTLAGQRTELDDYIDELNALRQQVAKIGHNVNQIAKKLNSGGNPHPGDTATLAQAERTLTAVGTTVGHIAAAANQAVARKAA